MKQLSDVQKIAFFFLGYYHLTAYGVLILQGKAYKKAAYFPNSHAYFP